MKKNKAPFLLLSFLLGCLSLMAQNRTITGRLTATEDNTPLSGATVTVKGTSNSVPTASDGTFSISVAPGPVTLVISSVGYTSKEVPVAAGQNSITITLDKSTGQMGEVVVIGYGTVKKSSLTASVSKLQNDKLDQIPVGRIEQAMAGRLAGVDVIQSRATPGSAPIIRIRGTGSIDGGNEPLVVIDGFAGAGLGSISMNDVESIEVLKDASSAAIYGSRAAGGVIIVTTKKGKAGKPKLNFNSFAGVSKPILHNDWITGDEYYQYAIKYQNREFKWDNPANDVTIPIWGDPRRPVSRQVNPILNNGVNTIWQDAVTQTAPFQNYNLAVSGGSENTRYYVSGTYKDEKGTIRNTRYTQYTLRANLEVKVNNVINFGATLNSIYAKRRLSPQRTVDYAKYPVFVAIQNPDGSYPKAKDYWSAGPVTSQANPMAILEGTFLTNEGMNNLADVFVNVQILKGLNFRSSLSTNINYSTSERFAASIASNTGISNGSAGDSRFIGVLNENTLSYNTTLNGVHDISSVVGASFQTNNSRNAAIGVVAGSFRNDIIHTLNNALVDPTSTNTFKTKSNLESYFGRINYGYKDKYLLSASMRADGSSRFGPGNKFGYFPSASVAWRISQEDFLRGHSVISNLKLRASYGVTGNLNIGDFSYLGGIGGSTYTVNNSLVQGQTQTSFGNDNLRWERTRSYDYGIDLGLFRNRLNITFDYYDKRTNDLLYSELIPGITGFTSSLVNVGDISNKGIEIELSSRNIVRGDFRWTSSFNMAMNRNKVLNLGKDFEKIYTDVQGMSWILRVGQPMFSYFAYRSIGVFQNEDQLSSTPRLAGTKVGNPIFEDVNKDGKITPADKVILGTFAPKVFMGLVNDFQYKNFDLSIALQSSFGGKMYNYENQYFQGSLLGAIRRSLVQDQWYSEQEPGNGKVPGSALSTLAFQAGSDLYIEDASFLNVRNINLGYTFSSSLMQRMRISNLRIFTSVSNALLITSKGFHGYNPQGYTGSEYMPGFNDGSEPLSRVITFGVNVGF
ncbi:MAG TPA: TonB-dependent receptor [Flavisolibacter sp.]|jgi:TonB-linked SusC/RagA family outer membrane protein|nr:TonB-dependent receptor [Flavisolibacter sp.]